MSLWADLFLGLANGPVSLIFRTLSGIIVIIIKLMIFTFRLAEKKTQGKKIMGLNFFYHLRTGRTRKKKKIDSYMGPFGELLIYGPVCLAR